MALKALGKTVLIADPPSYYSVQGPVAALNDGTLLIAETYNAGFGVTHLARYTADGELLPNLDVVIPGANGYGVDVKALSGGGFALLYNDDNGTGGSDEFWSRAFSADGTPLGAAVHIGDGSSNGAQVEGYLIATRDGGYYVEYIDNTNSSNTFSPLLNRTDVPYGNGAQELNDVYGAFVGAAGAASASANLVAGTETAPGPYSGTYDGRAGDQRSGAPATLLNGAVVTPYFDTNYYTFQASANGYAPNVGAQAGISIRLVTPGGVSSEIRVSTNYFYSVDADDPGHHPQVLLQTRCNAVALPNGGFAVVWGDQLSDNNGFNWVGRFFDSSGNATSGEVTLLHLSQAPQGGAAVVGLSGGGFALAYNPYTDANGNDAALAAFDNTGALLDNITVAGGSGDQHVTGLTLAPDGSVDLTWYDSTASGTREFLQRYVLADASQQILTGDASANVLSGGAGNDWIDGEEGNDTLSGGGGADHLYGGAGADILTGGVGADVLSGGSGADVFRDSFAGLAGDTITDLAAGDLINVTDASYSSFAYQRIGTTLSLGSGQTVSLSNNPGGRLVVGADASGPGGVDLGLAAHWTGLNDFTADGHADMLWRSSSSGAFSIWAVAGNALADQETRNVYQDGSVGGGWQVAGTFDVNGDGLSDLVWRNSGAGLVTVWTANGSGFTANAYVGGVDSSWTIAGLGDFNGDGKDDLLWRNASGTFSEWQSSGTGFNTNAYVDASVDTSWKLVGIGDFDGDGKSDLLWRNTSGVLTEWRSTGTGFAANVYGNAGVGTSWHVAAVGDFDGDGKDDILWRSDSGVFSEWRSTGTGFTENVYVDGSVDTSWTLQGVFDFNDDGKADLLWRNANTGTFTVWQSTGSGFIQNTLVDSSQGADWTLMTHHYDFV